MANNPAKRALPLNPHPDHLRKEAKARLASLKGRMPQIRLTDVQLILAREYGFPNWGMLQAEAARRSGQGRQLRKAIAAAWALKMAPIDGGQDAEVESFFRAGLMAQVSFIVVALTGVALVMLPPERLAQRFIQPFKPKGFPAMKYLPLIWAALWRKPARSILIFVSAAIGFTLFGVTIGVNAGMRHLADLARLDRLYVSSRYGTGLTLAQEQEIAGLKGIRKAGAFDSVTGYVQRPGNIIAVMMTDAGMRDVFSELPLTAAQWRALDIARDGVFLSRSKAARVGLGAGGQLRVITARPSRRDGSSLWTFEVLGVVDDIAFFPAGFAVGNYEYLEQARPLSQSGHAGQIWLLVADKDRAEAAARMIELRFANSANPVRSDSEKAFLERLGGPTSVIAIATEAIASVGLLMIAFLTGNAIAQSVRERIPEYAILKTIGFTDRGIIGLVFAEAAIPCLAGAGVGLAAATFIARMLPRLVPSGAQFPVPSLSLPVVLLAFAAALLIAFITTALPALRLARLDVATVLARK